MRNFPNTPHEWLVFLGIFAGFFFLRFGLPRLIDWYLRVRPPRDKFLQRLIDESAKFRHTWRDVHLWQVPYGDLSIEAERCDKILTILEQRLRDSATPPDQGEFSRQIACYRASLDAICQAMAYISAQFARPPQYPQH